MSVNLKNTEETIEECKNLTQVLGQLLLKHNITPTVAMHTFISMFLAYTSQFADSQELKDHINMLIDETYRVREQFEDCHAKEI